jgi:hypothetical protein
MAASVCERFWSRSAFQACACVLACVRIVSEVGILAEPAGEVRVVVDVVAIVALVFFGGSFDLDCLL